MSEPSAGVIFPKVDNVGARAARDGNIGVNYQISIEEGLCFSRSRIVGKREMIPESYIADM